MPDLTEWGIVVGDRVVTDPHWHCAADVMASTHGFGSVGPYRVVVRSGDGPWADFWED